jgi:hypothetical protein
VPNTDRLEDSIDTTKARALINTTSIIVNWAARQTAGPAVGQTLDAISTVLPAIISHLACASPTKAAPLGENNTERP